MILKAQFSNNSDYGYVVGKVRVREKRLLTQTNYQRLIEAEDTEELFRILGESEFQMEAAEVRAHTLDELINIGLKATYEQMLPLSKEPDLTNSLLFKYDFNNLKILLKQKFMEFPIDVPLNDLGTIPPETLSEWVKTESWGSMPLFFKEIMPTLLSSYEQKSYSHIIDFILDKHYFHIMLKIAKEFKNDFMIKYYRQDMDLHNICNYLRIRALKERKSILDEILLKEGFINYKFFIDDFSEDFKSLATRLSHTNYANMIKEGLEGLERTNSLSVLEKLADDFLIEYLKQTKYLTFGVEPLLALILAVEMELKNLRIIVIAKTNNLPNNIILERLRETYV